jgi:hypothetical protein
VSSGSSTTSSNPIRLRRRTIAILEVAGRELRLSLVDGVEQGSFNEGVTESAHTHDKGGVFDLRGSMGLAIPDVEKALRDRGVAAWIHPRLYGQRGSARSACTLGAYEWTAGCSRIGPPPGALGV